MTFGLFRPVSGLIMPRLQPKCISSLWASNTYPKIEELILNIGASSQNWPNWLKSDWKKRSTEIEALFFCSSYKMDLIGSYSADFSFCFTINIYFHLRDNQNSSSYYSWKPVITEPQNWFDEKPIQKTKLSNGSWTENYSKFS